jgi:hypothetical protein
MALTAKQQEILGGATPQDMSSLSPDQQAMMVDFNQQAITDLGSRDNVSAPDQTVEKAEFRSWAQGATLGIADEIEAMARTMASSRSYEEIRDEIRAKLNAYQKAHPGEALSYELLGAVAPTALAYIAPIPGSGPATTASTVGRTASWLQKAKPVMQMGAAEGAFAGYATGQDGVVEDLARAPLGGLIGAGGAGLTTSLMGGAGSGINAIINKTRQLFGDKASTAVGQELQRLVDATGFSPEEILQKIQAGEIIADNATLEATIRALRAEMPKGGKIDTTLSERAKSTKEIARGEMQEGMTPGVQGNVYRDYTVGDDVAKAQERKLYKGVFKDAQELTPEIVDTLADAIKRFPNAKEALGEIYQAKGSLVPFFTIGKNGEVKIVRMPTLEDAEIVRRGLAESTSGAFKTGKGGLGEPLGALETKLRTQLDEFSPSLQATRQNASNIRGARDAYKLGRGSLSKNVDELAVDMERLIGTSPTIASDAKLKAFRAGAMNALRDKIRKMPTYLGRVADEGSHENQIMRTIFPEDKIDDLLGKAKIAGQSQTAKQRVLGGSPTAPQQKASDLLGTGGMAARASQGDPIAQLSLASDLIKQMRPEMTTKQKDALVDLLLSEDPDFVRKALMNESGMAKLQQKINTLGSSLSRGAERGVTFEAGREGGDLNTGLLNLFTK